MKRVLPLFPIALLFSALSPPPTTAQPVALASAGFPVLASGVFFDTTGPDNHSTTDYYGVQNFSSTPIYKVSWDISVDTNAFFDFDGGSNYGGALEPVVGLLVGMAATDISWALSGAVGGNAQHPSVLIAVFNPPMAPGAGFRFSADTDNFVSNTCPGENFGIAPCTVRATTGTGTSVVEDFVRVSSLSSEATCAFPTSGGGNLAASGCVGAQLITGTGWTPATQVAIAYAFGQGNYSIPAGPCAGSTVGILAPQLGAVVTSDIIGTFSLPVNFGAGVCGNIFLQAVELPSCGPSNVVTL